MTDRPLAPLAIYVVYHPDCTTSVPLANALHTWFRLDPLSTESSAGPPIYFRRALGEGGSLTPRIRWQDAELNVVIALVGHHIVGEPNWLKAVTSLSAECQRRNPNLESKERRPVLFLPVALHDSFYQSGSVYRDANPIRLFGPPPAEQARALQRATTGAITRAFRQFEAGGGEVPPLDVFLSHAKADGTTIAEQLRDSVRKFGQLTAWYDANDLPYGCEWDGPMADAAEKGTAAMIATVTDAYPTRPWCLKEASFARTPRKDDRNPQVWTVQPVVAVYAQTSGWSTGVPMFSGVPRTGWAGANPVEPVVDRLVLEAMLAHTHRAAARSLAVAEPDPGRCYLTWLPDVWSLVALSRVHPDPKSITEIVYPSHRLPPSQLTELRSVLPLFGESATLSTYEAVWPSGRPKLEVDMTSRTRIALSAGGLEAELAPQGIGMAHVDELMLRIARQLLADGHPLSFGGALNVIDNNLTTAVLDAARSWLNDEPASVTTPLDPSTWPLHNHAAWPYHTKIGAEQRARLVGTCAFTEVDPPGVSRASLPTEVNLGALTPAQSVLTANALTAMRKLQAEASGLRIVWAGRIEGAAGWLPGILEEVTESLAANHPVLVLGGYGGCAALIASYLRSGEMPVQLTYEHAIGIPKYAAVVEAAGAQCPARARFAEAHHQLKRLRDALNDEAQQEFLGLPSAWLKFGLTTESPLETVRLVADAAAKRYPQQAGER